MFEGKTFYKLEQHGIYLEESVVTLLNTLGKSLDTITIKDFISCITVDVISDNKPIREILDIFSVVYPPMYRTPYSEIDMCANESKETIKEFWIKKNMCVDFFCRYTPRTLFIFLEQTLTSYKMIVSVDHLWMIINYFMYDICDNYYNHIYTSGDKYIDSSKLEWDEVREADVHLCETCELLLFSPKHGLPYDGHLEELMEKEAHIILM